MTKWQRKKEIRMKKSCLAWLSFVMAAALLFGLLPSGVFAYGIGSAPDGLFADPVVSGGFTTLSMYTMNQNNYKNSFNLQGHDINLDHLGSGNTAPTESSTEYAYITSALPATCATAAASAAQAALT